MFLFPLPPDRYAVSVYLEENNNKKLDTNFLGIPKEPVGGSNNPKSRMGTPHFDDSVFTFDSTHSTVVIKLIY